MAKLNVSSRYRFGRAKVKDVVKALLKDAPSVLRLFGKLMTDARVSTIDRALVAGVIAYVISPIDLIPDFLGLIGVIDDLFLIGLALDRLLSRAPARVVHEHWKGSVEGLLGLTAELQALGDAVPGPVRRVLLGSMQGDEFGREAREMLFPDGDGDDDIDAPSRRRGRRRASRWEIGPEDEYDDEQGHMDSEERVTPYRNRL